MKDKIIQCSISELQKEGLRFSLDKVAVSLKISKKTIYKYFPKKEDLAVAVYKTFYDDALDRIARMKRTLFGKNLAVQLFTVYFHSYCMARGEIFNKYALNGSISALAQENHAKIRACIEEVLPQAEKEAFMIIVEGSLQKLCEAGEHEQEVIERLAELLC